MLLCRIKDLLLLGHISGKHSRQEAQTLVGRLIPVRDRRPRLRLLSCLAGLIGFAGIPEYRVQRFQEGSLQLEMLADLRINDHIRRHYVLVIQVIGYKLLCRLQIFYRFPSHRDAVKNLLKNLRRQRLVAPGCR